jgi:hypothetical protein
MRAACARTQKKALIMKSVNMLRWPSLHTRANNRRLLVRVPRVPGSYTHLTLFKALLNIQRLSITEERALNPQIKAQDLELEILSLIASSGISVFATVILPLQVLHGQRLSASPILSQLRWLGILFCFYTIKATGLRA